MTDQVLSQQAFSQSINFSDDSVKYLLPTWDELDRLTLSLASQIRKSHTQIDLKEIAERYQKLGFMEVLKHVG